MAEFLSFEVDGKKRKKEKQKTKTDNPKQKV